MKDALDVAMLLDRCGREVHRDPNTGLYVIDGTVPPTEITLPQYEAGLRVLELRERAAIGTAPR
jgi:hypothetical protein